MKRSPNHRPSPTGRGLLQAVERRARMGLLLILMLAALAACGLGTNASAPPTPTAIPSQGGFVCLPPARTSVAGGCEVEDAATRIFLRVANAYADATGTVMQLQTTNTAGYPLDIGASLLALQSGQDLASAGGTSGNAAATTIYEPLPPDDFGPQIHLVATAHFITRTRTACLPRRCRQRPRGSRTWIASP